MTVRDVDNGYKGFLKLMDEVSDDPGILVGIREDKGSQVVGEGVTLAAIATFNEFGTGTIPARSFLRSTVDEKRATYAKALGDVIAKAPLRNIRSSFGAKATIEKGFGRVGLQIVKDVQKKITALRDPPNAPATIRAKGSDNPLIDTGRMRQSIDFELENL